MKFYKNISVYLVLIIAMILLAPLIFQGNFTKEQKKIDDALTVIHRRKSVRQYLDRPVSKEDLLTLLKAGMAAPTGGDRRPWAFVAITEEDQLIRLADILPYGSMLRHAGAAIIVCGILDQTLPDNEKELWVLDCSAASENILLATEAIGLGAVWLALYPMDEQAQDVRDLLGIPRDIIPLNVISIGYPTGAEKPKNKYNPAKIHWNKW